jgi:hypothetical protein
LGTSLDTSIYAVYNGDNVNDSSGNSRNGTNVNNVTFTTGKIGNAFTFNGSSNYVALPNSSFDFTGDFSISTWVKIPANPSGWCGIFSNYNYELGSNLGYLIQLTTDRKIAFGVHSAVGSSNVYSTTTVALNTWYHITVRRDSVAKRSELYINGVFEGEAINTNITIGYGTRAIQPTIGAIRTNNQGVLTTYNFLNGSVDGLTIWNKKLTDNEILSLYNEGTGAEYPFSSQLLPSLNDAVGTNNGTRPSSTLTGGALGPSFTTGKIGKAFTFDGLNDYVSLGNDKFNFAGSFSISAWVNLNTVSGNQTIMSNLSYVSNISNGWLLLMRNNKLYFEFYKNNGTYDYLATNTNLTTSTWYHITVVRVASQSTKLYINGVLDSSNASAFNPTYTSSIPIPSSIGAWKYDASNVINFTNGKIDALNIWNRELTAADVTELYNAGTGKQYPN